MLARSPTWVASEERLREARGARPGVAVEMDAPVDSTRSAVDGPIEKNAQP